MEVVLTGRQKQIVEMYYIDNKSITEIADILGVNKSTIHRTLKRAIKKLVKTKNIFDKSCTF